LIIVALAGSIGLHWALLQSVAWVSMVVTYSQDAPITEALAKTFDGQHPCKLCKGIAAGKKSEQKAEFPAWIKQLEFVTERAAFIFTAPAEFRLLPETTSVFRELAHQPPVPPPRCIAA
jgi:hypothetical protein